MAWRIDESVIRGEIDNRIRGRVTGRIWLVDRTEPIELDLAGDAWRDLAGRRLEFVNPTPKPEKRFESFARRQAGVIGDCTASRKVKVLDVSMEEFRELDAQRKPFPWHWGNSLYLEWFSTANGRVVIESASYQLTIDPESAWEMTEAEQASQQRANAGAMGSFMSRLGDAMAPEVEFPTPETSSDESARADRPLTEAEAEKMFEDSERLMDRIQARMDREGPDADYGKILEEELERRARERGDQPLTPEEEARRAEWIDQMNQAAEEALANPDPELEAELETKHPLAEQAFELAQRLMEEPETRGWIAPDASEEHPLVDLAGAVSKAAAKLAGALDGYTWPPGIELCAGTIVRLKRARGYLDDALLAADVCNQQNLADHAWLAAVQRELSTMAHECDTAIGLLRAKLEAGFD